MISDTEQEVIVDVAINDLPSESYFRIALQQSAGKQYFGYMKNDKGDWVKIDSSQDCKNYYHVYNVNTNSITLVTKIGQDNSDGLNNGQYSLKVRRYTATCSSSTDSDASMIQVNLPSPTSMDTPIPTPTKVPTPTHTPTPTKIPTPTRVPTPTKVPTITKVPTVTQTIVATKIPTNVPTKISVLAASTSAMPTSFLSASVAASATPIKQKEKEVLVKGATTNYGAIIPFVVGGLFFLACGILIFIRNRRKNDYE